MIKAENLLLIDIETVPMVRKYTVLSERMQRLWDKKSLTIDKDSKDASITFSERAGIYAEFGKIICIGIGYFVKKEDHYILNVKTLAGHDERSLLMQFSEICNQFFSTAEKQFCGHNIREFDIPYICRRSYINQIVLPQILADLQNKKPWENPMMDTLQFWKFGEYKNFTSVDLLSAILNIDTPKDDIDGSEVAKVYWKDNDLERIVRYCAKDVVTVAQILMRLNGMPLLEDEHVMIITEE